MPDHLGLPSRYPPPPPQQWGTPQTSQVIGSAQGIDLPRLYVYAAFGQNQFQQTYTWTDLTPWVLEYTDSGGRHHVDSRFETSTATILLDGTDGRFYEWNTSSPYSPNITVGVPIWVRAYFQGNWYDRYYGYADSWRIVENSPLYADVELQCSDGLKLLSLCELTNTTLYPNLVTGDGAIAYYRLNDLAGSVQAADATGTYPNAVPNSAGIGGAFGQTPTRFYDTAASLVLNNSAASTGLLIPAAVSTAVVTANNGWTIELLVSGITTGNALEWLGGVQSISQIGNAAGGSVTYSGGGGTTSSVAVNDGATHHIAVTGTSVGAGSQTITLYVDGVATTNTNTNLAFFSSGVTTTLADPTGTGGRVSDVAVYASVLTATQVANHATAARYFQSTTDSTGTRISACLAAVGIPTSYQQIATGQTTPVQADTSSNVGTKALGYIGIIAETEIGTFYQTPSGIFQFNDRYYGFNASTASGVTFSNDALVPGIPWEMGTAQLIKDDLDTWGTTNVSRTGGTTQSATNAAVTSQSGPRVNNLTGQYYTTDAQSLGAAQWRETIQGAPVTRVDAMRVSLWTADGSSSSWGANVNAVLGLKYMSEVTVRRGVQHGIPFQRNYVVERIETHVVIGDNSEWTTTFMLSPNEQAFPIFTLDDAVYGLLDMGNELGF